MDQRIDNSIKKFISIIEKKNIGLNKAFLFGSYAKNNQHAESDIDIALILDHLDDANKFDLQVQLMILASQFDTRIEPHPLSKQDFQSNNPFALEIKSTGIEISLSQFSKA
jgi:uncharacterized protein